MSLTQRIDVIVDDICKDIRESPDNWTYKNLIDLEVERLECLEGEYEGALLAFMTNEPEVAFNGNLRLFTQPQKERLIEALESFKWYIENKAKQDFINTYGGN